MRRVKSRSGMASQLKAGLDGWNIIFNSRYREFTEVKILNERKQIGTVKEGKGRWWWRQNKAKVTQAKRLNCFEKLTAPCGLWLE
jgi:hypothetical protein